MMVGKGLCSVAIQFSITIYGYESGILKKLDQNRIRFVLSTAIKCTEYKFYCS